jgi:hypothetical protein
MKTIAGILTAAWLLMVFGTLNAQTQKGTFMVGDLYRPGKVISFGPAGSPMNISFGTQISKSDATEDSSPSKHLNFNLMPKAGYFVADNVVVGIDLTLSSESQKENDYKYKVGTLGAGPFVRYYIPLEKVLPFFELNGSLGRLKYKYSSDQNEDEYTSSLNSIGGGAGVAILLGRIVTFDMLAGYSRMVMKDKEGNEENWRDITHSVGLKLGFTILLGPAIE